VTQRRRTLRLVAAALALVAIGAVAMRAIGRSLDEVAREFTEAEMAQVDDAANTLREHLDDIIEDLQFAAQLVRVGTNPSDATRELSALLTVVKHYRIANVYDEEGRRIAHAVDPRATHLDAQALDPEMARAAKQAFLSSEQITSWTVNDESYRVFTIVINTATGRRLALALVVDMLPLVQPLRLLAATPGSSLLVLGPHGHALPGSDRMLAAVVADAVHGAGARTLILQMREGARGTVVISAEEARNHRLGSAEQIAVFAPAKVTSHGVWSIAKVSSSDRIHRVERSLLVRWALGATGVFAVLVAIAIYLSWTSRRALAMRERLRHAEELAHAHEKIEKVLDHIPSGVAIVSADDRVTAANQAMSAWLGQAAVGATLRATFARADGASRDQLVVLIAEARRAGNVRRLQAARLQLFGHEGRYNVYAVPLAARVREAELLIVIEDVTEVDALSRQLVQAEKLSTVGVLAAGIAHEIGTPLSVVRGRAEHLREKSPPDTPTSASLAIIIDQIDYVTRTVRQLLDFSRQPRPAATRDVDLAQTITHVRELLRLELVRRRVTLNAALSPSLPPLAADPDSLQQVLVNLVMNAIDACREGGSVLVEATAASGEPGKVRIAVVDDGCGIAEEHRSQVFDPFFTTKKRGKGTGMGLTVVAQIVRDHGATITIDSSTNVGTRVVVTWPTMSATSERHVA